MEADYEAGFEELSSEEMKQKLGKRGGL